VNTHAEQSGVPQPHRHILVADDDESVRGVVHDYLVETGYRVSTAANGAECIKKCLQDRPDLLVLDVMMPEMSGFEVCGKLRGDPATADVPIMMISGLTDPEHKIRGFSLGVFHYMSKPFSCKELRARIENILARQKIVDQNVEQSKVETVRQLAVALADKINNPLAEITALCQILSKNIDDRAKVIEIVEMISESVDSIYSVLLKLTSVDHLESTNYTEGISMIDVDHLSSGADDCQSSTEN
jgi:CheY-like chemotaxis protein